MDKMFIRKDVYEELLEKGFGKKDLSKLTKKKITDKNGHTRTVYVRNGEQPAEVKQPKAQEGLTPEKKARYEEMLEKVVAGPEENALFVKDKGMLNKKEAIAHLSEKLGKHADEAMKNANDKANNLTSMSKEDKISLLSEYMHKKYGKTVESWKETYKAKLSDDELNQAFKDFSETHQETIKEYQKKKPVSSAAEGHLESDTPQNTDITKEDEERFGKQALSGLSGKRTAEPTQDDMKENYLDAKNEGGKDIADENRIDTHSKNAINLNDSEVKKMQKVFDYIPENATASQIMNTIYDEDKALYKKLSEMDIEYKKLHPEAEGKTFGFDLAAKYLEDSFNEYKKDHEVGKDKFAEMSVEDIRKEQQNLLDDYNQYYNAYKNGKNDGSKLREYFKKFDVYKTALDKKSKE